MTQVVLFACLLVAVPTLSQPSRTVQVTVVDSRGAAVPLFLLDPREISIRPGRKHPWQVAGQFPFGDVLRPDVAISR